MSEQKRYDDGGLAMSIETSISGSITLHYGMTLADYFAGQALAGVSTDNNFDFSNVGSWCYDQAEAMIAEKRKREEAKSC